MQAVLADARFHEQLLVFDRDLSAIARARLRSLRRCTPRGAVWPQAARRSRWAGPGLMPVLRLPPRRGRLSQAQNTPPSLRFLGRKVYLSATVVTLISAMLHGTTPARLTRLSSPTGIDRRTLARWRVWWRATFTEGAFAQLAKARFMPPLDIARLPASLLDRFAGAIPASDSSPCCAS